MLKIWAKTLQGQKIDMDGGYAGECHDIFLSYLVRLGGKIADGYAPSNWTDSVYKSFPVTPGIAAIFDKLPPGKIRAGDVVFWSNFQGVPHVAVALSDETRGIFYGIDQNPHPATLRNIPARGAIGILRPKQQTPNPQQKRKKTMNSGFYYINSKGQHINIIVNTESGFYHEWESPDGGYNTPVAQCFAVPASFARISRSHAEALAAACAAVRTVE